jgi:type II secretory pathway predicted ATPase ExeA
VARAQENLVAGPEYLEFFGLNRLPFARLSVPSNIFDSEQYSLLMSHLAAATADTDCLVIIRGADGSGKTTLLNRYLTNLDEDIFFATIDDTCKTATQFYGLFLTQLGFKDITGSLSELRRITEQFLMHQASGNNTVLLVVDNAHHINPTVLEQLRRVTEFSLDGKRVISVVIAGNATLSRIVDSPAMSGLKFRSHVDFHLRMFSEEETAEYINYRLDQAGNADAIEFEANTIPLVHRFTGGSPGPINKLCNAVLAEACSEETSKITVHMVRTIASNQELLPHVVPLYNKGRRKSDLVDEEIIQERRSAPKKKKKKKRAQRNNAEIARLKESLAETRQALCESEKARKEAIAALKKGDRELTEALNNANKDKEKYEKLNQMRTELQSTVRELKADLKTADRLGSELVSVESQLREAQEECKQLRFHVAGIPELEQKIADKDARIAILTADLARMTESSTATQAILPDQAAPSPPREKKKGAGSSIEIAFFEISHKDKVVQTLSLDDAPSRIMIGRDDDSDLHLDSEFVSRHHALMFCSNQGVRIEDLNSFNGTLLNLKKVNRADIFADDLITIGDFQIRARSAD